MRRTATDPTAFIGTLAEDVRAPMQQLDRLITGIMGTKSRVLWRGVFWGGSEQAIIGYGALQSRRARGATVDWFMVGLARQKHYFSLYVNAVADGQYVAEQFAESLGRVKVGKASISFRSLEDVHLPTLRRVLRIARDDLAAQSTEGASVTRAGGRRAAPTSRPARR